MRRIGSITTVGNIGYGGYFYSKESSIGIQGNVGHDTHIQTDSKFSSHGISVYGHVSHNCTLQTNAGDIDVESIGQDTKLLTKSGKYKIRNLSDASVAKLSTASFLAAGTIRVGGKQLTQSEEHNSTMPRL